MAIIATFLVTFSYQQTPLHVAASKGRDYTVESLVKRGADINIKDKTGVCEIVLLLIWQLLLVLDPQHTNPIVWDREHRLLKHGTSHSAWTSLLVNQEANININANARVKVTIS